MKEIIYTGTSLSEIINQINLDLGQEKYIYKENQEKDKITVTVYKLKELSNYIVDFLKELIHNMGLEVEINAKWKNEQIYIDMTSDNNSILIGREGRTLKSLQNIVRRHIYQQFKIYPNLLLNVGDYQKNREEKLIRLAKKLAKDVKNTRNPVELDDMNSYERLIIHNALKEDNEIITTSVGQEPNRHIVIKVKED